MNSKSLAVVNWRCRRKQELINYKGGKCQICGYDKVKFLSAFSFHHRDPSQKEFGISSSSKKIESLMAEVDKCDLLCVRCHAELHDALHQTKRNKQLEIKRKILSDLTCKKCNKKFRPKSSDQKLCSVECKALYQCRVERPLKEVLEQEIKENSWVALGRKYGVSDNAIRKWARKYELLK